jgi:hypothetical protein
MTLGSLSCARSMMVLLVLGACSGDAERAAQGARLAALEADVRKLEEHVKALKAPPPAAPAAEDAAKKAFKVSCLPPWLPHAALGATLWACRSPAPSPEGFYPQCSVVTQPQLEIETKSYFEFAYSGAPQLRAITNVHDQHIQVNGADAFEATFEDDPKTIPLKMLSVLFPHGEATYAITCFAPRASFDSYQAAFRKIIESFTFSG